MTRFNPIKRTSLGLALAAALAAGLATVPSPVLAQPASAPANELTLSAGTGQMVRLNGAMTDLFVADTNVADVQVRSPTQLYIFGKAAGSTTVYATNRAGRVLYSANVRVGQNLGSVDQLLQLAMPEAQIQATTLSGTVLLTGTVAQPDDAAEAERLVQAFVGTATQVITRLRTATPQQVMLKVTIAEVSRTLTRNVGVNWQLTGNDFAFARGRDFIDGNGNFLTDSATGTTAIARIRDLFGLSGAAAADLDENNGLVTILAEPTLTSLSGETASFLAGGEFPIPISQSLGNVTVEFRQFGVGLAFTPYVLADGRISMRVRPEVSELSSAGAIEFNGFEVPSLTIRRTETTVELGSGQSLVIGGLMRNVGNNSIDRTPFLGSIPILGALFRSNNFRRDESELVIVVTPYLVQPVSANQVSLPTDGFRIANDAQRIAIGQTDDSRAGETRPVPTMAAPATVAPGVDSTAAVQGAAQPGFDF